MREEDYSFVRSPFLQSNATPIAKGLHFICSSGNEENLGGWPFSQQSVVLGRSEDDGEMSISSLLNRYLVVPSVIPAPS
jgi:hypothetical protein